MTQGHARALDVLQSMGLTVWQARPGGMLVETEPQRFEVGEGRGSVLLLAPSAEFVETRIAGDIGRVIGAEALWGWPSDRGEVLGDVASERLLSAVIVLADALPAAAESSGRGVEAGPAPTVIAMGSDRLLEDSAARREFWRLLCREGLVRGRGSE